MILNFTLPLISAIDVRNGMNGCVSEQRLTKDKQYRGGGSDANEEEEEEARKAVGWMPLKVRYCYWNSIGGTGAVDGGGAMRRRSNSILSVQRLLSLLFP